METPETLATLCPTHFPMTGHQILITLVIQSPHTSPCQEDYRSDDKMCIRGRTSPVSQRGTLVMATWGSEGGLCTNRFLSLKTRTARYFASTCLLRILLKALCPRRTLHTGTQADRGGGKYLTNAAGVREATLCQPLHLSGTLVVNDVQVMLQGRIFRTFKIYQFFSFIHPDLMKNTHTEGKRNDPSLHHWRAQAGLISQFISAAQVES